MGDEGLKARRRRLVCRLEWTLSISSPFISEEGIDALADSIANGGVFVREVTLCKSCS